jgi:hypothetical protein
LENLITLKSVAGVAPKPPPQAKPNNSSDVPPPDEAASDAKEAKKDSVEVGAADASATSLSPKESEMPKPDAPAPQPTSTVKNRLASLFGKRSSTLPPSPTVETKPSSPPSVSETEQQAGDDEGPSVKAENDEVGGLDAEKNQTEEASTAAAGEPEEDVTRVTEQLTSSEDHRESGEPAPERVSITVEDTEAPATLSPRPSSHEDGTPSLDSTSDGPAVADSPVAGLDTSSIQDARSSLSHSASDISLSLPVDNSDVVVSSALDEGGDAAVVEPDAAISAATEVLSESDRDGEVDAAAEPQPEGTSDELEGAGAK